MKIDREALPLLLLYSKQILRKKPDCFVVCVILRNYFQAKSAIFKSVEIILRSIAYIQRRMALILSYLI